MDSKRYEAFVAAVETGSMSGAAKQLDYTPSGIIRLINALEGELGFPVLARTTTGVTPTREGARMLPIFKEMTRLDEKAEQTSARIRGLSEGTLTLGALSSLATFWLPPIIKEYQQRFPEVHVNIIGGSNAHQLDLLEQRRIDCALCHKSEGSHDWTPLGRQETVAWVHKSSPLTRNPEVLVAELDGLPFIMTNPDDDSLYQELFYSKGLEPDIRFTTSGWFSTYSLVAQNLGASLCCGGVASKFGGEVVALPLSPRRFMEFGIATLGEPSPALEEFLNIAQQFEGVWPTV